MNNKSRDFRLDVKAVRHELRKLPKLRAAERRAVRDVERQCDAVLKMAEASFKLLSREEDVLLELLSKFGAKHPEAKVNEKKLKAIKKKLDLLDDLMERAHG